MYNICVPDGKLNICTVRLNMTTTAQNKKRRIFGREIKSEKP